MKTVIRGFVRTIYRKVPLDERKKTKLKDYIYENFTFFLKNTEMYRGWIASKNASEYFNDSNETSCLNEDIEKEYIAKMFNNASEKSDEFVEDEQEFGVELTEEDIKLIAFYLPQFHPIPENDEWWGRGFTEWTNVTKAVPQFIGHHQPQLPIDVGFYDLRNIEVQKRQIELAKKYGVYGFCFHHYWFGGKRLLETPVDNYLKNPKELDFPFCLCWANENWTRRWDGMDNEVLIAQKHSPEDDIEFIKDLHKYIIDKRYIRINGKPLIIIYRPQILPNPKDTIERWRKYCQEVGIGDIFIVGAKTFGFTDPTVYGIDAAVDFPPHCVSAPSITEKLQILNQNFKGIVLDYAGYVRGKHYLESDECKTFKTVSPGWDNTARKPNNPHIFHGSDPSIYKEWLNNVIKHTKANLQKNEQFVFINAWNEWAEGAQLEPDRRYGYGYLRATAESIIESREYKKKKILYVSHDAHFHGAQILSLNIIKQLKEVFNYDVYVLLKSGGKLEEEFKNYATRVYNLQNDIKSEEELNDLIKSFKESGIDISICNTVITGDIVEKLSKNQIKSISLIHELPGVIKQYGAEKNVEKIKEYADTIIFPSNYVKEKVKEIISFDESKLEIRPQGLYKHNPFKGNREKVYELVRTELNIPKDSKIVLGVGYADLRKGIDLFVEVANKVVKNNNKTYFVWIGAKDVNIIEKVYSKIKEYRLKDKIIFVDPQSDISRFYAASDVYAMTSREDPFPSVILDSMNVGVTVVGFEDAGGFKDIVTEETGVLVPYLNLEKMAEKIIFLLENEEITRIKGLKSIEMIEGKLNFIDYIYFLLEKLGHSYKKVSAIVPNYNYERYLPKRIDSILDQSYPVYELIFLDDKSKDNSIEVAKEYLDKYPLRFKIFENHKNSGSVFKQWSKGIDLAKGEYTWIAEADDLASEDFLARNMQNFMNDSVILSYSQSKPIDTEGNILAENYLMYTDDIDKSKWKTDYISKGINEIKECLSIKNTIPNVSGVVFRKTDINPILNDLIRFKIAGDWLFYTWLLEKGDIAYISDALNYHRRHENSVTKSEKFNLHYDEIVEMQGYIINKYQVEEENITEKIYDYRNRVKEYLLKG